jgi:hypothetical protein
MHGMAAPDRERIRFRVRYAGLAVTAMRRGRWWSSGFSGPWRSASQVSVLMLGMPGSGRCWRCWSWIWARRYRPGC